MEIVCKKNTHTSFWRKISMKTFLILLFFKPRSPPLQVVSYDPRWGRETQWGHTQVFHAQPVLVTRSSVAGCLQRLLAVTVRVGSGVGGRASPLRVLGFGYADSFLARKLGPGARTLVAMGGRRRGAPGSDEDFSFVSPVVKYLLFLFNLMFWVSVSFRCRTQ